MGLLNSPKVMKKILLALIVIVAGFGVSAAQDAKAVRFSWGAAVATSIDMTEGDMSNIGLEGYFGIKMPGMQMLGLGTGMNVPVTNSLRSIPIYMIARTNFRARPSLLFMDARSGVAVSYIDRSDLSQTGVYCSLGLGIKLASSDKFQSHLIIAYTYVDRRDYLVGEEMVPTSDLHMATLRLGISF